MIGWTKGIAAAAVLHFLEKENGTLNCKENQRMITVNLPMLLDFTLFLDFVTL